MAIFAVLMPQHQLTLVEAIQREFPDEHLSITDEQWLVASAGTVIEVTAKLGIYDAKTPKAPPTGNAIVVAISAYYGRAPTTVWDWIRSRLEAQSHG